MQNTLNSQLKKTERDSADYDPILQYDIEKRDKSDRIIAQSSVLQYGGHWSATNVNSCSLETTSSVEDVERTLKQLGDSEYVLLMSNRLE